ncbi:unnamed protein product [Didymodactylos carnosus]|uniref:Basic leucine zipper domain-containing protein n=1 Tax=Didymodactylos carnosus TaxID=1234261 RepID=A0A815XEZ3_9BILA|nr:unnamed protein product [Didymodactylos carnosus]CAF1556679.1 unnamed protein product [Didymodactylos carnosus]CAF4019120.1 unnamed protein product [Didymodactylos carnosus]CAF4417796.1 unnamed protein product [Didymodactylos carnosus]
MDSIYENDASVSQEDEKQNHDNEMDDDQIISMKVKELNALLKTMKPAEAQVVKRRRRILKNKGYAASSRNRQTSMVENLSVERNQLVKQVCSINHLQRETDTLDLELRAWKQRCTDLKLYTDTESTTDMKV